MSQTELRWEWRMFAKQIDLQGELAAFERTRHVESSETYLISVLSQANLKIRDGELDIKTLESVDRNGLEQWKPDTNISFPLSPDRVMAVYGTLNLATPELDRDDYDFEAFRALIGGDGRAMAVDVNKVRDQYDVNGCTVEVSDVTVDGDAYSTVAAENASQSLVLDTLEMFGFRRRENVNYVRLIKAVKGFY